MSRPTRSGARRRAAPALALSLFLPAAALAATILVDTDADADVADADCSLREAIVAANTDAAHNGCAAGNGVDRIEFALTTPATIALAADLPVITESAAVVGPGMADLAIDGGGYDYSLLAFDTASDDGLFYVADLTLTRGWGTDQNGAERGGGATVREGETAYFRRVRFLDNRAENDGGGLLIASVLPVASRVTLHECVFEDNEALGAAGGGGLHAEAGSELVVLASTFSGNRATAEFGSGGAMRLTASTVTIRRSTISGNLANSNGGGIYLFAGFGLASALTITDSTVTANESAVTQATGTAAGIWIPTSATPAEATSLTLRNNLIAGNLDHNPTPRPDLVVTSLTGLTLNSSGFNLIGSNSSFATAFIAGTPNGNGDFVGTSVSPLDPLLGALADNGGPTPTHLPLEDAGSLVVDHGDCFQNIGDQRGYVDAASGLRPVDNATVANHAASDGCDIGAAELGAVVGDFIFEDDFESGTTFSWSATVP